MCSLTDPEVLEAMGLNSRRQQDPAPLEAAGEGLFQARPQLLVASGISWLVDAHLPSVCPRAKCSRFRNTVMG